MQDEQDAIVDLGAASQVTQGFYWPPFEEAIGTPDHRDL